MKSFKPYTIRHIKLDNPDDVKTSADNQYFVFWWNDVPLGHLWLEGKSDIATENNDLPARVVDAVKQSLDYYSQLHPRRWPHIWSELLVGGDTQALADELDMLVPKYPIINAGNKLSVVICTRNRPKALGECINALMASTDTDFELLIVDNASDDDSTEQVVKAYKGVKYIKEPRKGLDIARNTGARHALNNIVAYTDDDVQVEPNWTAKLKALFESAEVMAVTGLVIPAKLDTESQYLFEKDWGFNKGYLPRTFDGAYFSTYVEYGVPVWDIGAGANMAFRRDVFDLVGWFDERLDVGASGCSGDSEFWYRILAEGLVCKYYPGLYVYHQHRETPAALKKQILGYMSGHISSVLVQYERYGHRGNLRHIYYNLPRYYIVLLLKSLLKFKWAKLSVLYTELRGCFLGWQYYHQHRDYTFIGKELFPASLSQPAVVANALVSVVIPCYNLGRYLAQAIESVLNQSYSNCEIVVIDDGSTDDTALVCKAYPQVKYVFAHRVGVSAARNLGVANSTGSFLMFLDADDYLYPGAIELNLWYFEQYKDVVMVSGAHQRVDAEGRVLPSADDLAVLEHCYTRLLEGNYIGMESSVMYRRDLFFSFFFDLRLKTCEDYDINLNITRYFAAMAHTHKIVAYRIHGQNMSANKGLMLQQAIKVLERQKSRLKTDAEIEAYNKGIKNWTHYYTMAISHPE